MISDDLLDILACPVCKTSVHVEEEELVCAECERRYPILDGMPVMRLEEEELEALEMEALGSTVHGARNPESPGSESGEAGEDLPVTGTPESEAAERTPPEGNSPVQDRVES